MLSVADRRPCLLLFDLDLFNDVPHGAIVVKLLLDLGKYYPQRGNLDGAKFKLLIVKFRP